MGTTLPFTPVEASLFLTLCGRALDSRSPHPYLADPLAGEILEGRGTTAPGSACLRARSATSRCGPNG